MIEVLHMWTFQKQTGEQADFYGKIVLFPTGLKVRVTSRVVAGTQADFYGKIVLFPTGLKVRVTSRVVAGTQADFYDKIVQPCCSQ